MSDDLKRAAAAAALQEVEPGMRLGLGTGSTASHFVRLLGEKVRDGLKVVGVPTSERTAELAREVGVPLTTLDETPELDLTVDGADEVDHALCLTKGGGGALLREKIVASASARMVVIVDAAKVVEMLGAFPLPIEINRFGLEATRRAIVAAAKSLDLDGPVDLRCTGNGDPFVTDGGHFILDASFRRIADPKKLGDKLLAIPGVVEHGLFVGLASMVFVAGAEGVEILRAPS